MECGTCFDFAEIQLSVVFPCDIDLHSVAGAQEVEIVRSSRYLQVIVRSIICISPYRKMAKIMPQYGVKTRLNFGFTQRFRKCVMSSSKRKNYLRLVLKVLALILHGFNSLLTEMLLL